MLGGVGLVTLLRLVQVGRRTLDEEQEREPLEPRENQAAAS